MLKILRPTSENGLLFAFSKREKSPILRAFALAAVFHLLLLVLFQVAKPFNFEKIPPLQPIAVEVDLGNTSIHVVQTEGSKNYPVNNDSPPSLLPFPQDYPFLFSYDDEIVSLEPDFSQIEQIPYVPIIDEEEECLR